ncbi:hypothetical protein [Sphaerisporangium sp. TRM90804]|uniref:hypothetical protein n=1 Tax=Sphaerisporangium sp. TRM90804 TaxID=3031113 RepID=UPI00244CB4DB|nr:hypothetical protein [Sphaerisporangium sp. TRM90804]MDH2430115.1 hypothetical protein [Sphaerisporangium sp. TRM90804]
MDGADGRVVIVVVVATVLFLVGRRFQRVVDTWAGWGKAVKAAADAQGKVPGAKAAAWGAFWRMLGVGAGALLLLALMANAVRHM